MCAALLQTRDIEVIWIHEVVNKQCFAARFGAPLDVPRGKWIARIESVFKKSLQRRQNQLRVFGNLRRRPQVRDRVEDHFLELIVGADDRAVLHRIEVLPDVYKLRQRLVLAVIHAKQVCGGVTTRMRARHGMKIFTFEPTRLLFDKLVDFGHCESMARRVRVIAVTTVTRVRHRLDNDARTLLQLQPKLDQRAELVAVIALRHGGNNDGRDVELLAHLDALHLHVDQLDAPRLRINTSLQRVELERRVHASFFELLSEGTVLSNLSPVSGDQQALDLAFVWTTQHVVTKFEELRVQRRLTAGEQHDRQFTFGPDQKVNRAFELIKRHRIALLVADDANRTRQIADVVDLEYR